MSSPFFHNLPFREHHLFKILEEFDNSKLPLDTLLRNYFRQNKACGSKDRQYIADTCYQLVRQKKLLDALVKAPATWPKRLLALKKLPADLSQLPLSTQLSMPDEFFDLLTLDLKTEEACRIAAILNTQAPTTIRVNTSKISRESLLKRLESKCLVKPTLRSPYGITFLDKVNFFALEEFQLGLFEVQDEGSQLVADLVKPKPGDHILDFCAGSGGKALAIAPLLQGKGQLYLHDVRLHALQEAKIRLKRASVQNAQILLPDSPQLEKLKRKMDWTLVDAPCSGTGTWRRNPDMKWRFSLEMVERLVGEQRTIFERALSFTKPNGYIVYATCSLLQRENEDQITHFLKTYPLEQIGSSLKLLPQEGGMDGFFGAVMKRTE